MPKLIRLNAGATLAGFELGGPLRHPYIPALFQKIAAKENGPRDVPWTVEVGNAWPKWRSGPHPRKFHSSGGADPPWSHGSVTTAGPVPRLRLVVISFERGSNQHVEHAW